jgi:alcohol dehydrogenase class-P
MFCWQELELEKFITPFSEINHAFDLMAKGEGIRCIIRISCQNKLSGAE